MQILQILGLFIRLLALSSSIHHRLASKIVFCMNSSTWLSADLLRFGNQGCVMFNSLSNFSDFAYFFYDNISYSIMRYNLNSSVFRTAIFNVSSSKTKRLISGSDLALYVVYTLRNFNFDCRSRGLLWS